jgi:hypothetical protein
VSELGSTGSSLFICLLHVLPNFTLKLHVCRVSASVLVGPLEEAFLFSFTCSFLGENSPPSLPFCLALYVKILCFFHKSKAQYFWISLGLCLLFVVALPSLPHCPSLPAATYLAVCFRSLELQESAECL